MLEIERENGLDNVSKTIDQLFNEENMKWGLRGAPYLWRDLKIQVTKVYYSAGGFPSEKAFEDFIRYAVPKILEEKQAIVIVAESKINESYRVQYNAQRDQLSVDKVFVEEYNHGGMSSGSISLKYWKDVTTPLLIERYRNLNKISLTKTEKLQILHDELISKGRYNTWIVGMRNKSYKHDVLCLDFINNKWKVYYTERGIVSSPDLETDDLDKAINFYREKILASDYSHCIVFAKNQKKIDEFKRVLDDNSINSITKALPACLFGEPVFQLLVLNEDIFEAGKLFEKLPYRDFYGAENQSSSNLTEKYNKPSHFEPVKSEMQEAGEKRKRQLIILICIAVFFALFMLWLQKYLGV